MQVEQDLQDIAGKWSLTDVLLLRRQGMAAVGEIISLVVVSSSSSEEAFAACRHRLARMKRMPTTIKTETYL